MAYFKDLSTYRYIGKPEEGTVNIGWLAAGWPFQKGDTPSIFKEALRNLCEKHAINHCAGHHVCVFCPDAKFGDKYFFSMGNGEIRVRGASGIWYVAPKLIIHYVEEHKYCPPQEFIDAVIDPVEVGKYPWEYELTEEEERRVDRAMGLLKKVRLELS